MAISKDGQCQTMFGIQFSKLRMLRILGKKLRFELQICQNNCKTIAQNRLELSYLSIHPEGYRTWFSFDDNYSCLVTIRFSIENEFTDNRFSLIEHMQIIWHIFQYRFRLNQIANDNLILHPHHQNETNGHGERLNASCQISFAFSFFFRLLILPHHFLTHTHTHTQVLASYSVHNDVN